MAVKLGSFVVNERRKAVCVGGAIVTIPRFLYVPRLVGFAANYIKFVSGITMVPVVAAAHIVLCQFATTLVVLAPGL